MLPLIFRFCCYFFFFPDAFAFRLLFADLMPRCHRYASAAASAAFFHGCACCALLMLPLILFRAHYAAIAAMLS